MREDAALRAEFGATVGRFLDARSPVAVSRDSLGGPGEPLWRALAEELGLPGLLLDERAGGQGGSIADLGAALIEAGRVGLPASLLVTAGLAVPLLARSGAEPGRGLLAEIVAGRAVVALALHEDSAGVALDAPGTEVEPGDGECRISGRKRFVAAGEAATHFIVLARTALVLVERGADGLLAEPMRALDHGRGLAILTMDQTRGQVLAEGARARELAERAFTEGALLTAADALGIGERCLGLAVDYAKTRTQFGRAIGSFQAIKHKLADMYAETATARSAVERALDQAAAGEPGWELTASMAKARAGDAVLHVVREAIHVHGGIGFTWEHELSHHFRRALTGFALFGTPAHHRDIVARALGV
ncbi:acyl-CoA dehydrogenase family protein [Acrocarpospora macrocephala]|uniref:Acyl-CoA dehydrogenase n=1 Tax=Acrocarpospora macrocephala TaxID=150177 RepID=A0A5M3WVX0_9ACTN|nr:acyl-CoA dehydrogenase [Acrocarpospora macrocephala]GES10298.1 acyl-CoA dehydrogenase [Acrocarpospora macrocephala]